jgi:hypothetical protein
VSWHFEGHPGDEDDAVCESGPESNVRRLINCGQRATNYSFTIPSPKTIIKIKGERGGGNGVKDQETRNIYLKMLLRGLWRSFKKSSVCCSCASVNDRWVWSPGLTQWGGCGRENKNEALVVKSEEMVDTMRVFQREAEWSDREQIDHQEQGVAQGDRERQGVQGDLESLE